MISKYKFRYRFWYVLLDAVMILSFLATTLLCILTAHGFFSSEQGFSSPEFASQEFAYSLLVAVLGGVLGFVVAVVITPYNDDERTQWSNLTSAIVGAVAGYGFSVIDDSVAYIFKDAALLTQPIIGMRIAVFFSYFGYALLYGFSYRRYYVGIDLEKVDTCNTTNSEILEDSDNQNDLTNQDTDVVADV